jgi:hypothetical protein
VFEGAAGTTPKTRAGRIGAGRVRTDAEGMTSLKTALRDLVYLGAVFLWSIAAFTILVTGVAVTASLLVFVVGVFVWIGFAYVARWTTSVDRRLAGWQRHEHVPAVYRRPPARGFMPLVKTISTDPQTWRDLGWLGLTSVAGFVLGLAAITAMGAALTCLTMPLWYEDLGKAFAAAGIGLVLVPVALLIARAAATAHAGLAMRILGPRLSASSEVVHGSPLAASAIVPAWDRYS